jgi:lysine-specific permease
MFILNAFTVKGYGEAEYWFAMIKVVTVLIFLLVGFLVDVGAIGKPRKTYGFENWKLDGAPFVNGVAGVITTSIISGFAFQVRMLFLIAVYNSITRFSCFFKLLYFFFHFTIISYLTLTFTFSLFLVI